MTLSTPRYPGSAWLLDVDDTLLDTAAAMRAAAPEAVAAMAPQLARDDADRVGLAYSKDAKDAFGRYARGEWTLHRSRGERLAAAFQACGLNPQWEPHDLEDVGARFESEFAPRFLARQTVFPDVEPALAEALRSGIRVGLLTNASEKLTRAKLRATPLAGFPFVCVVTRDTLGYGKPDERVFEYATRQLVGEASAQTVSYIGDSLDVDVRPAAAAGLTGVLIERSRPDQNSDETSGSGDVAWEGARIKALTDLFDL